MAGAISHPFLIWPDESTKGLVLIVGIQGVEALVTTQEERKPLLNLRQLLGGERAHPWRLRRSTASRAARLARICCRTAGGSSSTVVVPDLKRRPSHS